MSAPISQDRWTRISTTHGVSAFGTDTSSILWKAHHTSLLSTGIQNLLWVPGVILVRHWPGIPEKGLVIYINQRYIDG